MRREPAMPPVTRVREPIRVATEHTDGSKRSRHPRKETRTVEWSTGRAYENDQVPQLDVAAAVVNDPDVDCFRCSEDRASTPGT
jgi:hypothetical protein